MALSNTALHGIVNNTPRARVVRHLKEWMQAGRLVAGSRLPPELQLAGKLNVSRTTIRLALAALHKEGLISSENRQWIVRDSVSPNRGLLSDSIAIIEPRDLSGDPIGDFNSVGHEQFIHLGATAAVRAAGYDAVIIHPERVKGDLIQRIISQRPKGAIILFGAQHGHDPELQIGKALLEGNVPCVAYGDINLASDADAFAGVDSVGSDHEAGSYALTKWLIGQGRKNILRFWELPWTSGKSKLDWLARRDRGYERAMREAGLEPLPALETHEPSYSVFGLTEQKFQFHTRVMAGYLVEYLQGPRPVDAIMANWDGIVGQIAAALRVHGKEPNKDVLIAGYDNLWDDLREVRKWEPLGPVATIDKRNLLVGQHLMTLLQERIDGKLFDAAEHRIVKPNLVIRPSAVPGSPELTPIVQPIV